MSNLRRVSNEVVEIPATKIHVDPNQPRKYLDDGLKQSIEEAGQDSPISVRPHPEIPDEYMIICGERRWRGVSAIGKDAPVDCFLYDGGSHKDIYLMQVRENAARKDLSLEAEVQAIRNLVEVFHFSVDEVAHHIGVSPATVAADLPISKLSDDVIQKAVEAGYGKQVLREIARSKDPLQAIKKAGSARGKTTKQLVAAVQHLTKQQTGTETKDVYDPAAGKALDALLKRVTRFVKTTAVSDAVAARTGKLDDLTHMVAKLKKLATEFETEIANQTAKRAA